MSGISLLACAGISLISLVLNLLLSFHLLVEYQLVVDTQTTDKCRLVDCFMTLIDWD